MRDMRSFTELLVYRIRELSKPMQPEPPGVSPRLTRLDSIKAVLLDVYGTMFVSGAGDVGTSLHERRADALGEALSSAGYSGDIAKASERGAELLFVEIEKAHARRRDDGIEYPEVEIRDVFENLLSPLVNEGLIQGNVSREAAERTAVEYECRVNPVWPMPGLREVLHTLRTKPVMLGIVSNAQFYTPLVFCALLDTEPKGLGFHEDLITWSFEIREAKPSIRIFECSLDPLRDIHGVSPAETLCVGNSMLNDIMPAARLGCRTAHFGGDSRSYRVCDDDPRCSSVEPDLIITDLHQLTDVI